MIDREEIYAFEDWWKRIQALIGRADTIVFVLSPDAAKSDVALKEVEYAASLNKRFAPIVCKRIDDSRSRAATAAEFHFFDDPPGISLARINLLKRSRPTSVGSESILNMAKPRAIGLQPAARAAFCCAHRRWKRLNAGSLRAHIMRQFRQRKPRRIVTESRGGRVGDATL